MTLTRIRLVFLNGSSQRIRKFSLWNDYGVAYGVDMDLFKLYLFYINLVYSKTAYNEPMQG